MRDCERCINARPYGGENDNRCASWSCEFIDRTEAIGVMKSMTRCGDCKYYGTHKWSGGEYACCTNIYGAVVPREPEDFCSRGEPKGE